MVDLIQWIKVCDNAFAVLATVGVAVFLFCCLECTDCTHRDEDEFFHRREV
jgi:hypothetical protein